MTQDTIHRRMDDFAPDELSIPELKLIQNVGGDQAKTATATREAAAVGDFYLGITDEVIKGEEGVDVILVDMLKTRTYWGRDDIGDEPPTCSSPDAGSFTSANGDDCHQCPFNAFNEAPWLLSAQERRTKCLVNYHLLVFRVSDNMPMMIRATGISTGAARNLLTTLKLNKKLAGQYHKAVIHVAPIKKKTASGEAFAFVFTLAGLLQNEAQIAESYQLSAALTGQNALQLASGNQSDVLEAPAEVPALEAGQTVAEPEPAPAPPAPPAKTEAPAAAPAAKKEPAKKLELDTDF